MDIEQQFEKILKQQFNVNYEELIKPRHKNVLIIIIIIIIIGIIILYKNNKNKELDNKK